MERGPELLCRDEPRRAAIRGSETLHGIDFVEVVTSPPQDNQRVLLVHFLRKSSPAGSASVATVIGEIVKEFKSVNSTVQVTAPEGRLAVRVTAVEIPANTTDVLRVSVDHPGDFGSYTLTIDHPSMDVVFRSFDFSFKAGCPTTADCRPDPACAPPPSPPSVVDYMAKDYASFRQALLDRLAKIAPELTERREADLGMTLVELLAYVGDRLSYYQDAVATEAYLETARRRMSVRRHARLVDYAMHDGASARAFVFVKVKPDAGRVVLSKGTQVLSQLVQHIGASAPPFEAVLSGDLATAAVEAADVVFETAEDANLDSQLNEIPVYHWGNDRCCLPAGATAADLEGNLTGHLAPGALLLLEEGEARGTEWSPGDRQRRAVVRITGVSSLEDKLMNKAVTRVRWHARDALEATLRVAEPAGDAQIRLIARGNIVLADHGRSVKDEPHHAPLEATSRAYRFRLGNGPLSLCEPLPDDGSLPSARELGRVDPQRVLPQVCVRVADGASDKPWNAVETLLSANSTVERFVVESGDDGHALLRFGDGTSGARLPSGAKLTPQYRIGSGTHGNVGADALKHVVAAGPPRRPAGWTGKPAPLDWVEVIAGVRNPLPAWGGAVPEPIERVKQLAPSAFRAVTYRAVTENDYARAAELHPGVARAVATFRWTGSWHTVFIALDPHGTTGIDDTLEAEVKALLERYAQTGYDLEIEPPVYVPIEVAVDVCVRPDRFRSDVEKSVRTALGSRLRSDGTRGFFHPDHFTFGQPVVLSALYAAVMSVDGVDAARVRTLRRRGRTDAGALQTGSLPMGRLEIARMDDDKNRANQGIVELAMTGGR